MEPRKKIRLDDGFKANTHGHGSSAQLILRIEEKLVQKLNLITFSSPVEYVYNPLEYAAEVHQAFYTSFMINSKMKIMFLGMNPGPWGMAQNGIPFGECGVTRDWFEVRETRVARPAKEHPARPVLGLLCQRSEVSGKRFWGLFQKLCGTPSQFFRHCFVYNLCPLAFLAHSGKNITPTELKASERKQLLETCGEALMEIVKQLQVEIIVGIGKFAQNQASLCMQKYKMTNVKVLSIPHPSPRNARSRNWLETTESILQELDLLKYLVPDELPSFST